MNRSLVLKGAIVAVFGLVLLLSRPIFPQNESIVIGIERISPRIYAIPVIIVAFILWIIGVSVSPSKRTLKADLSLLGALQLFLASLSTLWNAVLTIRFEPLNTYGLIGIAVGIALLIVGAVKTKSLRC